MVHDNTVVRPQVYGVTIETMSFWESNFPEAAAYTSDITTS